MTAQTTTPGIIGDLTWAASPEALRHIVLDLRQMKTFIEKPLVIARADGVWYEDVYGKRYLDGISGIFVVNIGHNNRRVLDAMRAQMERFTFAPPLHATNPAAVELANLVASVTPGDLNTVKLFSGGSEATEAAMKMARQYHRQTGNPLKYKIIARYQGYHGSTMGALSATGTRRRKAIFEPGLPGFLHVMPPACYHCPFGQGQQYPDRCCLLCATTFNDVIEMEGPETVAAVIVEPIGNTGGIITPPPEYLPMLRETCDRHNVLLIFDEVITGFGRTGQMFAAQTFGTTPDILCMGKGMSSGYSPLAGVAVRDHVAAAFWGDDEAQVEFSHGQTYGGNPLSSAAGVATIHELIDRDLPARGQELGDHLRRRLAELEPLGVIGDVRGKGLLIGVEFVRDRATHAPFGPGVNVGLRTGLKAIDKGLILRFDPHWIAFAPPLTSSVAEVDQMFDIFAESLRETLREL